MAQIIQAKDIYDAILKEEEANGVRPKYATGFKQFDDAKRFARPGTMHVIAGMSGGGKSTFARTLTHHFIQNGTPVCFFSMEESYQEFLEESPSLDFYMPDSKEEDRVGWVLEHALKAKNEKGTHVIFIDNLTHMENPTKLRQMDRPNAAQIYALIAQEVHDFAIEHDLCIFLLHHVNHDAGANSFKADTSKPMFNQYHLRESSQIANFANSVIFIHRILDDNKEETRYSLVYAAKWRSGGKSPKFTVAYNETAHLFEEEVVEHWLEDSAKQKSKW